MKVRELIEALQAFDPEAEAYRIYDWGVVSGPIEFVRTKPRDRFDRHEKIVVLFADQSDIGYDDAKALGLLG